MFALFLVLQMGKTSTAMMIYESMKFPANHCPTCSTSSHARPGLSLVEAMEVDGWLATFHQTLVKRRRVRRNPKGRESIS